MNVNELKAIMISHFKENISEYKLNMINRYIDFVCKCNAKNKEISNKEYHFENHHILPKSIWPEYKSFKLNKWNKSKLSLREHIICHYMLYKIFAGKMTWALYQMIPQAFGKYGDVLTYEENHILSKYYEKSKVAYKEERKGFGTWKDEYGTTYFLHRDDPKIKELGLTWLLSGYKFSDEQKKRMSNARNDGRGPLETMYFLSYKAKIYKDQIDDYLSQGWTYIKNGVDDLHISEIMHNNAIKCGKATSEKYKGQNMFFYEDGKSYGYLYKDDPIILELNLSMDKRSDKMIAQRARRTELAKAANTGAIMYNNGEIQKKFKESDIIPAGWVKGGLPRKLVKGHERKYDLRIQENIDRLYTLLEEYEGDLGKIALLLGLSATNLKDNMKKYMPGVTHHSYWPAKKRYKVDADYAIELYKTYNGDFTALSEYIGTNEESCRFQYKKLYNIE